MIAWCWESLDSYHSYAWMIGIVPSDRLQVGLLWGFLRIALLLGRPLLGLVPLYRESSSFLILQHSGIHCAIVHGVGLSCTIYRMPLVGGLGHYRLISWVIVFWYQALLKAVVQVQDLIRQLLHHGQTCCLSGRCCLSRLDRRLVPLLRLCWVMLFLET